LYVQAKKSPVTALLSYSEGGTAVEAQGTNGLVASGAFNGVVGTGSKDHGVIGITKNPEFAGVVGHADRYGVFGYTKGNDGAAVFGQNDGGGRGVVGLSKTGDGVEGFTSGEGRAGVWGDSYRETGPAVGVHGFSKSNEGTAVAGTGLNRCTGVGGWSRRGIGVYGHSENGSGVRGVSDTFHGVVGSASTPAKYGVLGHNPQGAGVGGKSTKGYGVIGESGSRDGVIGVSTAPSFFAGVAGVAPHAIGVAGVSGDGIGVTALALNKPKSVGLYAKGPGAAAIFDGDVSINGNLTIKAGHRLTVETLTNKHGVVVFADGTQHLAYSIESPEAWLEDFGEASLLNGKAHVALETYFKQTIDARRYHVFLTPYGDNAGLYVSRRTKGGFDVAERKPGKSNVRFSWRVVAKPKDTKQDRFAKTTIPQSLDRIHSAVIRDNLKRRLDVAVLNADGIATVKGPKLVKRIKPNVMHPASLPKLSKLPKPPPKLKKAASSQDKPAD
jgi:hypothetical protein